MTDGERKEANRDTEDMVNTLVWPGPIEEGMVTAGAMRELQEHDDRLRKSRQGEVRPLFTAGQKLYGILSVGLVVFSVVFFIWLLWIFIQKLTLGPP